MSQKTTRPRVYARIRPTNDGENSFSSNAFYCDPNRNDCLVCTKDDDTIRTRFDRVFSTEVGQQEVYDHLAGEVLNTLFSGYNTCIFAYGQTGSGKTYTMEGDAKIPGLIPRLLSDIFAKYKEDRNLSNCTLAMSFVQIYQEKVQDLLRQCKPLEIHLDRSGHYIAMNAQWSEVGSVESAMVMYAEALSHRATNATEINTVSSRSHAILMLKLQWDEFKLPGSHFFSVPFLCITCTFPRLMRTSVMVEFRVQ